MARPGKIEKYRNFGVIAHIDAGKPLHLSGFYFIQVYHIRLARCTKGRQ